MLISSQSDSADPSLFIRSIWPEFLFPWGGPQESPAFPSPPCNAGCAPLNASEPIPSWYQHPEKLSASDGAMVFSQELGNAPKGQDALKMRLFSLARLLVALLAKYGPIQSM
jgi:hypothetical protein